MRVRLTSEELNVLPNLAHEYERTMGFVRHIVVLTSPARIRHRYRYIVQESKDLETRASTWARELRANSEAEVVVELTVQDAVAFWGRTLSSLRTRRSRRKLKVDQLTRHEAVDQALRDVLRTEWAQREAVIRAAIATRRRREKEWMLADLGQ